MVTFYFKGKLNAFVHGIKEVPQFYPYHFILKFRNFSFYKNYYKLLLLYIYKYSKMT